MYTVQFDPFHLARAPRPFTAWSVGVVNLVPGVRQVVVPWNQHLLAGVLLEDC